MNGKRAFVMTRQRTWILTAISVALFVLLSWIFADGLFRGPLWNAEDWVSSPLITYLLIGVIVLVGWRQASRLPAAGVPLQRRGNRRAAHVHDRLVVRVVELQHRRHDADHPLGLLRSRRQPRRTGSRGASEHHSARGELPRARERRQRGHNRQRHPHLTGRAPPSALALRRG